MPEYVCWTWRGKYALLLINDYLGGQDARVCLLDVEKKVCTSPNK